MGNGTIHHFVGSARVYRSMISTVDFAASEWGKIGI